MSDIDALVETVREAHAKAMEALAADVHPLSGSAIRDWEKAHDAALSEFAALAERQRDASLALIGNAVLNQDAFDDNVSVTIPITEWRGFTSAVLAGGAGDE